MKGARAKAGGSCLILIEFVSLMRYEMGNFNNRTCFSTRISENSGKNFEILEFCQGRYIYNTKK